MKRFDSLPSFIREALCSEDCGSVSSVPPRAGAVAGIGQSSSDAERSLLALEESLSDVIELEAQYLRIPESTLARAPVRFEKLVVEPPHRYAPFFSRAALLFDLSEDAVVGELARLREPAKWRASGIAGVSWLGVRAGPAVKSAEASFVRIEAGARRPGPRNAGVERVLVLEGRYEDSRNVVHPPGDIHEWQGAAEGSFKLAIAAPCIFGSVAFRPGSAPLPLRGTR